MKNKLSIILLLACALPACASNVSVSSKNAGSNAANPSVVSSSVVNNSGENTRLITEEQTAAPETLVADLYKQHDAKKSPFFQTKSRAPIDKYFTKATADLIWKDAKATNPNEVGALDFDPLYNTQDLVKKNFAVGKAQIQNDAAKVRVTYVNFKTKMTIIYLLSMENGKWKIRDIDYGDGSTLVSILKESAEAN